MNFNNLPAIGLSHIENWLKSNGFTQISHTIIPDYNIEIQADGLVENILISFKTVLYPDPHAFFTNAEKYSLKEIAGTLDRVPYIAYLSVDKENALVGVIIWERLV